MADISNLNLTAPDAPLDLTDYPDQKGKTPFQLPRAGEYVLRAPESIGTEAFSATRAGALQAQIDPTIVGPTNEGFNIRFVKVSATTFERDGKLASRLGDYLRACGVSGVLGSPKEMADAVESTAGRTYRARLDWKARNPRTGYEVKGMANFPKDEAGNPISWVTDPEEKDENGNPVRVFANLDIRSFIPASE